MSDYFALVKNWFKPEIIGLGFFAAALMAFIFAFPFFGLLLQTHPFLSQLNLEYSFSISLLISILGAYKLDERLGMQTRSGWLLGACLLIALLTFGVIWISLPIVMIHGSMVLLGIACGMALYFSILILFQQPYLEKILFWAIIFFGCYYVLASFGSFSRYANFTTTLIAFLPFVSYLLLRPARWLPSVSPLPQQEKASHANTMVIVALAVLLLVVTFTDIYAYSVMEPELTSQSTLLVIAPLLVNGLTALFIVLFRLRIPVWYWGIYAVSCFGVGITLYTMADQLSGLRITAYLLLLSGDVAVEFFYWLSLWKLAPDYGYARSSSFGLTGYFLGYTLAGMELYKLQMLDLSSPLPTGLIICSLFILLPIMLRFIPSGVSSELKEEIAACDEDTSCDQTTKLALDLSEKLSPAEQRVFELLCQGYSNPQIAEQLFISTNTVKFHVKNILRKTESQNRYELMVRLERESGC